MKKYRVEYAYRSFFHTYAEMIEKSQAQDVADMLVTKKSTRAVRIIEIVESEEVIYHEKGKHFANTEY